jgi:hypothetical protein
MLYYDARPTKYQDMYSDDNDDDNAKNVNHVMMAQTMTM